MTDLIKALQIFSEHYSGSYPTWCAHDVLGINELETPLTYEEKQEVEKLGFFWSEEYDGWISFKYGSC